MAVYESGAVSGDVFVGNPMPPIISRGTRNVTNAGEADIKLEPGYPMAGTTPVLTAGLAGATITGLVAIPTICPAGRVTKVPVFERGPIAVNGDALPENDYAGDAFVHATLLTKIVNIPDLVIRREPPKQATHLT